MTGERYFAIAEETSFNETFVAPTKFLDQQRDRVIPDQGWIFPDTVDDRDYRKAVLGAFTLRGPVDFIVEPENGVGFFLKWLLGSVSTVDDGQMPVVAYKHTFTPGDTVKSLRAEIGAEADARQLTGLLVDSMEFRFAKKQLILATVELVGAEEADGTIQTPNFSTLKPFVFHQVVFEIDDSDKSDIIEGARLRVRNNVPYDEIFSLGSRYARRIEVGKRDIEGELDLYYESDAEVDKFLAGTSSKLEFTATSDESTGSAGAGFENYKLSVTLPQVYYLRDVAPHPERRERQVLTVPFKAVYDDTAGYSLQAELVNTVASY